MDGRCPLCHTPASTESAFESTRFSIVCDTCGTYIISREAAIKLQDPNSLLRGREYILSGIARHRTKDAPPVTILGSNIYDLVNSLTPPQSPLELLDHVLLYFADQTHTFSEWIRVDPQKDYPTAYAKDSADFAYALEYGASEGHIERSGNTLRLTPGAWTLVERLRRGRRDSDQAFVAMWFDDRLIPAWKEALQPALAQTGYRAVKINEKQFNDKIDDQIVAEIRRSSLLVADVTGHRAGVYFEAGFAMGLGLPVIWTCAADDMKNAHFDTRQYNHIVWGNPEELKTKLVARIEATGLAKAASAL